MDQMGKLNDLREDKMDNKRKMIYRHNGLFGSAGMIRAQCRAILTSCTATDETKELASKIDVLAQELQQSLDSCLGVWRQQ